VFKDLIKILLFIILRTIPKDNNLLVFGDRAGRRLADNSRYLFLYLNKNYNNFNCVWITKDAQTLEYLRRNNYKVYYSNSLIGIYYCLRAKFHIYNFLEDDIHKFITLFSNSILLWHGVLPKKLNVIDIQTSVLSKYLNKKMCKFFTYPNEELSKNILDRFPVNKYQLLVSNLPRNLIFRETSLNNMNYFRTKNEINFIKSIKKQKKNIFGYFPTWRSDGLELFRDLINFEQLKNIDKTLENSNSLLLIKRHMNSDKKDKNILYNKNIENIFKYMESLKNFRFIDYDFDLNSVLTLCDVLISDYSGVIFDFLYQDKPIITYAPDYKIFKEKNGFSLDPVENKFTHYVSSIEMLNDCMIEFCSNKVLFNNKFKDKREVIKNQVFLKDNGIEKIINLIKR
jgi:CDP-glycerol glycerophosphotransferase